MNRIFGAKKKVEEPKFDPNAPTLSDTSAKMDTKVTELDEKIKKCDDEIKGYMAGMKGKTASMLNKQKAVQALKRKKMLEQQREQIMGTQFNIDQMAFTQESMAITANTVEAMSNANIQLKQQMKNFDIDKIEKMQDEMADLQMDMEEVNELMTRNYALPDGMDDISLEAEFADLEAEMKMEQFDEMLAGNGGQTAAPSYLPANAVPKEADPLAALEAEAARA